MNKLEMNLSPLPADRDQLVQELKALIIHAVNLHHLAPEEIRSDTAFGPDGLNLDSVDVLEVVVAVEQRYQLKVKDAEVGRQHFGTIGNIADFILQNRV